MNKELEQKNLLALMKLRSRYPQFSDLSGRAFAEQYFDLWNENCRLARKWYAHQADDLRLAIQEKFENTTGWNDYLEDLYQEEIRAGRVDPY